MAGATAARHGDDSHVFAGFPETLDRFKPIDIGHDQIGDHNLEGQLLGSLQRGLPVAHRRNAMAGLVQRNCQTLPESWLVVHDQYPRHTASNVT